MNARSADRRPLRRSSRKSSHDRRDDALSSRFRRLVAEALEDRCLLSLGIGDVGQVANLPHGVANLPHGVANLPHGVANLPHGVANLPHDVANLPHDAITPAAAQAVELFNVSPALFV